MSKRRIRFRFKKGKDKKKKIMSPMEMIREELMGILDKERETTEEYKRKLNALKQQRIDGDIHKKIKMLEKDVQKRREENKELKELKAKKLEELERLKAKKNAEYEETLSEEERNKLKEYREKLAEIRAKIDKINEEHKMSNLKESIETLQAQLKEIVEENNERRKNLFEQKKRVEEMKKEVYEKYCVDEEDEEKETEDMKKKIAAQNKEEIERLESVIENYKISLRQMSIEQSTVIDSNNKDKLVAFHGQLEKLQRENKELEEKLEYLEKKSGLANFTGEITLGETDTESAMFSASDKGRDAGTMTFGSESDSYNGSFFTTDHSDNEPPRGLGKSRSGISKAYVMSEDGSSSESESTGSNEESESSSKSSTTSENGSNEQESSGDDEQTTSSHTGTSSSEEEEEESSSSSTVNELEHKKVKIESLEDVFKYKTVLKLFVEFMKTQDNMENVEFYQEYLRFKRKFYSRRSNTKIAQYIYDKFIRPGSKQEINIASVVRESITESIEEGKITFKFLDAAAEEVFRHMETNSFSQFTRSDEFRKLEKKLEQGKGLDIFDLTERIYINYKKDANTALNLDGMWKGTARNAVVVSKELSNVILAIFDSYYSYETNSIDLREVAESVPFLRFAKATRELQRVKILKLDDDERMAFFLNVYNVLFMHALIKSGFPGDMDEYRKFLDESKYQINRKMFSLNDIMHGILRSGRSMDANSMEPYFDVKDPRGKFKVQKFDPRVHFGAFSITRPTNYLQTYSPSNYVQNLDKCTQALLKETVKFKNNSLIVPYLFKKYGKDFGPNRSRILAWIMVYLPSEQFSDIGFGDDRLRLRFYVEGIYRCNVICETKSSIRRELEEIRNFDKELEMLMEEDKSNKSKE